MTRQLKSLAFAAALSALTAAAAHAQTVSFDLVTRSQSVSYADLDLSSQAGMKTLTARIKGAAKTVCGPTPEHGDSHSPYDDCIKSAVDRAIIQVARAVEARRLALNSQPRGG